MGREKDWSELGFDDFFDSDGVPPNVLEPHLARLLV